VNSNLFLAERSQVTVELMVRLLSVCRHPSVIVRNKCIVAKRCEIGLGCYWLLIESRILAFKWHENYLPWMTLKDHNALWYANPAVLWLNGKS